MLLVAAGTILLYKQVNVDVSVGIDDVVEM